MTDQVNPTAGEQEQAEQPEAVQEEAVQAIAPAEPRQSPPSRAASLDMVEIDEDEDEGDEEEEGEESEEGGIVEGPAEYIQREKSGRGRRIGGEVRPEDVDYKNIPLLSRFLDRRGRILGRRKTRVSAKVQRRIVQAIKRARHLSLLPYTAEQTRIVRKRR